MHKFDPGMLHLLLDPARVRKIAPARLLRRYGLRPGHQVADIGCGPGVFTRAAARLAGPRGRVFAIDVQPGMLEAMLCLGVPATVLPLLGRDGELPLPDSCADFCVLGYVIHETVSPPALARETFRVCRPGGRVLLLDWHKKREERGPRYRCRLPLERALAALAAAGFAKIAVAPLARSEYAVSGRRPR